MLGLTRFILWPARHFWQAFFIKIGGEKIEKNFNTLRFCGALRIHRPDIGFLIPLR